MPNQITGRIDRIGSIVKIPSKSGGQSFIKREVTLNVQRYDSITGEQIGGENFPTFEFTGDRCAELDKFNTEQLVTVSFDLQGRKWQNQDGEIKYITSVRGYRIELYAKKQTAPASAPEPGPVPSPNVPEPETDDLPF